MDNSVATLPLNAVRFCDCIADLRQLGETAHLQWLSHPLTLVWLGLNYFVGSIGIPW